LRSDYNDLVFREEWLFDHVGGTKFGQIWSSLNFALFFRVAPCSFRPSRLPAFPPSCLPLLHLGGPGACPPCDGRSPSRLPTPPVAVPPSHGLVNISEPTGSRLRSGEVFAYGGSIQNLKDLKDKGRFGWARLGGALCVVEDAGSWSGRRAGDGGG